jgi:hypothetical protein
MQEGNVDILVREVQLDEFGQEVRFWKHVGGIFEFTRV